MRLRGTGPSPRQTYRRSHDVVFARFTHRKAAAEIRVGLAGRGVRCAGRDDGQTSHALQSQVNAETAATLFTIAHSQKIFTGWFLTNLRGCNAPYPLEDEDKPGAFPEQGVGKGEAYRTLVASEAPPRLVQESGGGFRCTCLPSPAHLAANPADGYLTSEVWRCEFAEGSTQCDSAAEPGRK
jgi:hypothetical protein